MTWKELFQAQGKKETAIKESIYLLVGNKSHSFWTSQDPRILIQKGLSICEAFAHAKAVVEYKYEHKEADLFIKFTVLGA